MAFEEEFGVEIPADQAETIVTVGDAVKYLEKAWAKKKRRPGAAVRRAAFRQDVFAFNARAGVLSGPCRVRTPAPHPKRRTSGTQSGNGHGAHEAGRRHRSWHGEPDRLRRRGDVARASGQRVGGRPGRELRRLGPALPNRRASAARKRSRRLQPRRLDGAQGAAPG